MNREDIIRLSQLAGFNWPDISRTTIEERLERFAALVAAHERERANNGRCIACGNHITERGGQVVPTLSNSPILGNSNEQA